MPILKNWGITPNFTEKEFACTHCGECLMDLEFMVKLQEARIIAGVPFKITSGFRCEEHNKAVGGSPTSSHMLGMAADISVTDSATRHKIVMALHDAGLSRIGIAKNFIHVDHDKQKLFGVMWGYW